jgi:hypothetical protein
MAAISQKELLAKFPPEVGKLVRQLSEILLELYPEMKVMPDSGPPAVIGFGYGTGYKDTVYTMILSQKGLKLGLRYDITLPDPKKLLEGTGKVYKYVQIKTSLIGSEALNDLIVAAHEAYLDRM